jgi:hypothetical protein
MRQWWDDTRHGLLVMAVLTVGLLVFLGLTWALMEALDALGRAAFVPAAIGPHEDLRTNRLLNRLELALPAMLGWIGWGSACVDWWTGEGQWRRIRAATPDAPDRPKPRRNRPPRRGDLPALRRQGWPRLLRNLLAWSAVVLALSVPSLRTYAVVADGWLWRQSFWSLHADRWPLSALTCVERDITNRGLITWDFHFDGDYAFTEAGMNPQTFAHVLQVSGQTPRQDCTQEVRNAPKQ